jgi:NAD-specific glutamate dehydrogenase
VSIPLLFSRLNSSTKVVDETTVEIFSTKMCIIDSGLYFKNTLLNSKERYIERSSSKIEDENVENSWCLSSLRCVKFAHVEHLSHTSTLSLATSRECSYENVVLLSFAIDAGFLYGEHKGDNKYDSRRECQCWALCHWHLRSGICDHARVSFLRLHNYQRKDDNLH